MNTKNNRRRRESVEKIERAFMTLMETKSLKEVYVSDICKLTGLNRSTFYANYVDIYDLADKVREKIEGEFETAIGIPDNVGAVLQMFRHIKENQQSYLVYFKLCHDQNHRALMHGVTQAQREFGEHMEYIDYHVEFFRSGINAVIRRWIQGGCAESAEEMTEIIKQEYRGRLPENAQ